MADKLPLVKLIELGYELCGSYSLPTKRKHLESFSMGNHQGQKTSDNNLYGHPQLTSSKALKAFVANLEGIRGQKKACRALRYIVDGSASPMETILVMMLTLPHQLGGYGLPAPVLNKRINRGRSSKQRLDTAYYLCDLYWPAANLAVEYDSDLYHTGADRLTADSMKRFDFSMLGIDLITVASKQIRNAVTFEDLAKLIARKLGKRLRYNDSQFFDAHNELRNQLL